MLRYKWYIFWGAALLLLFFGNGQLLITDSVESNYALTAKEMVLSGDWVSPQIYGQYWYDKPVFFYWLTALSFKIFGFTEFAARFFPAVFGLLSLWLTVYAGKKLFNEKTAFISGIILLTSTEFFLISKSIITDSTLFFFFSGALVSFYLAYSTANKNWYYGMYAAMALATLTKGPIGFLLPGLIMVLFLTASHSWRELKHMKLFSGTLLFAVIAVPWYAAMVNLHGSAFIDQFFGTHNFLRATVSEHPRDDVFYYYTLVLLLAFFPWCGFLPRVLRDCVYSGGVWHKPEEKKLFLLIWAATVFFFFQNMATKYLTYTYPMMLPLALLTADYISVYGKNAVNAAVLVIRDIVYLALFGGALWCWFKGLASTAAFILIGVVIIAGVALTWYKFISGSSFRPAFVIALTAFVFNLLLIPAVAVPFAGMRSAKDVGLELKADYPDVKVIGLYGKYPTSAVFYSGKRIVKLVSDGRLSEYMPEAYSWKVKNVMPFAGIRAYGESANIVVVAEKDMKNFMKEQDKQWSLLKEKDEYYILRKV